MIQFKRGFDLEAKTIEHEMRNNPRARNVKTKLKNGKRGKGRRVVMERRRRLSARERVDLKESGGLLSSGTKYDYGFFSLLNSCLCM